MHPIGIDLGTTYSAISKWTVKRAFTGSEPYNINTESSPTLPSKVFLEEGEDGVPPAFIVGSQAIKEGIRRPDQYVTAVKRSMDDADFRYNLLGMDFSPVDISAEIIKRLLREVEGKEKPSSYVPLGIVVTVPHYFRQHQNVNTYNAALKAIRDLYTSRVRESELENLILGLLAEPIAAGLDYAFSNEGGDGSENVLVFDLGGGTFDVTIITLTRQGSRLTFEVRAVDGNDRLGGEDFDASFFAWMCEMEGINLEALDSKTRANALKKILPEVTKAKETLTHTQREDILIAHAWGSEHFEMEVRRKNFEDCIQGAAGDGRNYYAELEAKLDGVLLKSGISTHDISCVLLAGGSSRIPRFRQLIVEKFGEEKCRDSQNVNLAIVRGAAIYAAYLLDEKLEKEGKPREHLALWDDITIKEITAHQLGLDLNGRFKMFIRDGEPTPKKRTRIFNPTELVGDGTKARLTEIIIAQGHRNDYVPVGRIALEDIYTHGRPLDDIPIKITFHAHRNLINIDIHVEKGNADGTDYVKQGRLSLKKEDEG